MKKLLLTVVAVLALGNAAFAGHAPKSSVEIDAAVAAGFPGLSASRLAEISVGVKRCRADQCEEIYSTLRESKVQAERDFAAKLFAESSPAEVMPPAPTTYQLQVRRGASDELATIVPAVGEPCYTTDTKELIMGDGVTPGGVRLVPSPANAAPGQTFSVTKSAINFTVTGNVDLFSVRTGRTFVVTGVYLVSTDTGHTTSGPAVALTNSATGQMTSAADSQATTGWASAAGRAFSIPIGADGIHAPKLSSWPRAAPPFASASPERILTG